MVLLLSRAKKATGKQGTKQNKRRLALCIHFHTYLVRRNRLGGFRYHAVGKGAEQVSVLGRLRPVMLDQGAHHDVPELVVSFLGEGLS